MKRHFIVFMILLVIAVLGHRSLEAQENCLKPDVELHFDPRQIDTRWSGLNATWSADGTQILVVQTNNNGGQVRIYDAYTGTLKFALPPFESRVYALWSPANTYISTVSDGQVQIWYADTGELLPTTFELPFKVPGLLWHQDEQRLFMYEYDGYLDLHVYDISTGNELLVLPHSNGILSAKFSPDYSQLCTFTLNDGLQLHVWDTETGTQLYTLSSPGIGIGANTLLWQPDNTHILTSTRMNLPQQQVREYIEYNDVTDADGLASGLNQATITIWDAASGQSLYSFVEHITARSGTIAQWSPDGSHYLTWSFGSSTVTIRDGDTGAINRQLVAPGGLLEARWGPDESVVLGIELRPIDRQWFEEGAFNYLMWDVDSGNLISARTYSSWDWYPPLWNPRATYGAIRYRDSAQCATEDGAKGPPGSVYDFECPMEIVIVDSFGSEITRLIHPVHVYHEYWNPAGNRFLTTDYNGTLRIWTIDDAR